MLKKIYLLLIFSLLLGGCQPASSPAATSTAAVSPTLTPTVQPLALNSCTVGGIKAECGYLHVPEGRNNPNSRILDLYVVVVRAYGPNRQPDPLFYIVGGPGVAVTREDIVASSHLSIFWEVNAQRDLVFLDQRGTNDKHRLTCDWPSTAIVDTSQQQMDDWMKQCLANLDGDPRFYTTVSAMRDLDQARAALGYDKINLYGISYGVAAAQVYMRMFPEHFRAAVLDHGNALDLPLFPILPQTTQSALEQLFTYCDQDEKCHAAFPDIRGDLKSVLNRLAKGTVVTSYTPPGGTKPASLSLMDLEDGIYQLMYSGNYGQIPSIVHTLASNEDWTNFAKSYSEQNPNPGGSGASEPFLFMQYMIDCFEPAASFGSTAGAGTGSYYQDVFMNNVKINQKICAALPKPDPALIYGPGKPAPLSALMFNSLLDPIFPPSSMDLALKEFTKSRVAVEPTEGHEPSGRNECRWSIIAQYIKQGSIDGLDTSCLERIKPSFVIGNN